MNYCKRFFVSQIPGMISSTGTAFETTVQTATKTDIYGHIKQHRFK
jgi:hypothetical protein